jgi:DNA-directed RNA polymerase subunit A"
MLCRRQAVLHNPINIIKQVKYMERIPEKAREDMERYFEEHKVPKERQEGIKELVRELYRRSAYDPEEPVGVVAAQSLSEPATQMSLGHDEKVILKHSGIIRIARIGEFIDRVMESSGNREPDGWEVCDVSGNDLFVPSLNGNEKMEWRRVKEISRHEAPEAMLEIRTMSGRKIIATDSHSFVTRKGNRITPVSGKNLEPGDRIPSLLFLPENCTKELETSRFLPEQRFAKKPLPEKLNLTRELGWIFGAYLAEGNATEFFVSFSNTDPAFLSRIREFARAFGFTFNEYDSARGFGPSHDIRVNSKQLSRLMKNTCRTGSALKKAPDFAYSANADFVSGLLSGYFDGDGNVSVDRRVIRASSRSGELMDGIALLLARFGIFSRKLKGRENTLSIPYKYSGIFRDNIGFCVEKKSKRLEALCLLFESSRDSYQDFVDMIGGFDGIMLDICRKLGLPSRTVNSFTRRQKIGRTVLENHIRNFESLSLEKGVDINNELGILRRMAESDVVWDEITGIKSVKPSGRYVYDFTVPGTETFTTFDGIVTHNTMRTYHFAGTAGIQVTLGLPRMLEIFDARKEPRTPTMTIFLKPEHQNIEAIRKIASQIREVKAKDVILSTTIDLTELWIKCRVDLKKLDALGITKDKVPKLIKMRNVDTSMEGPDMIVVKSKKADLRNLHKLKYSVLESHVKGIKGISQVVVTKEGDEWVITTLGSNLKRVFEIEGVDYARTYSNNIFEIYDVLGAEAARNVIIKQAQFTMEQQGLGVDVRYVMLLADLMCMQGDVRAIGRYGISGQKASVLVRASFEETKKHFTAASIMGEVDHLRGTVENIMTNQVAPIGTGAFKLIGRIPEFPRAAKPARAGKKAAPKAAKKAPAKKAAKKAAPKKTKPPKAAKPRAKPAKKPAPKKKPAKPKPKKAAKPASKKKPKK